MSSISSTRPEFAACADNGGEFERLPHAAGLRAPTAATYWRTLRHLRWSQLGYLALRRVLPRSHALARIKAPVGLRRIPGAWPFRDWQPEASRKMIATREFTFLNRTVPCNGSIPWNDRRLAKLWLYHLNYFDFLNVDFALPEEGAGLEPGATGDIRTAPALAAALALALDWCANNPHGTEVGWEPFALSLRIVNWLKFFARHGRSLEVMEGGGSVATLLESLGVQVARLERRLEKDLLGNHLLKNIKALLFAGALLESPGSARWWAIGEELLAEQLREQILPDGGHFERSPMYHSQVLEDLAEIQLLCRALGKRLACADLVSRKIRAMAQFLHAMLHPDGEIPLFNDSGLGGARAPADLLALAELTDTNAARIEPQVMLFPDTGYGVIRNPESQSTVIFDCGPLGPDYQPGHGHCDVLSYELSLHGHRVVVDTGASTYELGRERRYERSTAAHNTVRIDDEEQAEIWASFRVGRRPRAGRVRGGANRGMPFVGGEHDAYQRLGVVHARTIVLYPPDTWIVVDHLRGSGIHRVESFLHFHPRVRVQAQAGDSSAGLPLRRWTVELAHQSYALAAYGDGRFDLLPSWYSERFGDRQPSTALRWTWQGTVPTGMVHVFVPVGASLPHIAADWLAKTIEIDGHIIPLC